MNSDIAARTRRVSVAITRTRMEEGLAIVEFRVEELIQTTDTSRFKTEMVRLINEKKPKILIINWAGIAVAGTDAFGVLLALRRRLADWKGEVRLCNMNPLVLDGFAKCGLDRIFAVYADMKSARAGKK